MVYVTRQSWCGRQLSRSHFTVVSECVQDGGRYRPVWIVHHTQGYNTLSGRISQATQSGPEAW